MSSKQNMLARSEKKLNTYLKRYDRTVSTVTKVIDQLTNTSVNIENTITGIEEYQRELADTTERLQRAKERNDAVVKNFEALLAD